MAYKGKRISNPVTNQIIEFIATSEETRGEQLEMLATWEPHSMKPAAHYHPYQDEIFKVLEGELTLILNGKTNLLHRGDSVHIPAKAVHAMWNNSKEKTVVNWKVFPAYKTEYFFETAMGLAMDGKTSKNGMPGILQFALLARKYRNEFRLSRVSYGFQRILFWLLIPFAVVSGKRAVYQKYID